MKNAILRTLLYADLFAYPLKKEEIWRWLVLEGGPVSTRRSSRGGGWKVEDGKRKWNMDLEGLLKDKKIRLLNNYYCLSGKERNIKIRKDREVWSRKKLAIANRAVQILKHIKWIKLIGITGSLAVKNSDEKDDIDLFFITSKNRLWLTRGLVVVLLCLRGLYRRPNKIANMICPNLFISNDNLVIKDQNLFIAHEICQMRPIFERENTYHKFMTANFWVKKYLPNA